MRGHLDERPLDNVNLNINVFVSTPDGRPPLMKGHFSDAKGLASQEGLTIYIYVCVCKESLNCSLSIANA